MNGLSFRVIASGTKEPGSVAFWIRMKWNTGPTEYDRNWNYFDNKAFRFFTIDLGQL
jgi:hypothetical protein